MVEVLPADHALAGRCDRCVSSSSCLTTLRCLTVYGGNGSVQAALDVCVVVPPPANHHPLVGRGDLCASKELSDSIRVEVTMSRLLWMCRYLSF